MNVILIGYRGTGKTTVGKALSSRLGWPFHDADIFLETKQGRTISDMVAQNGWQFFRAREKEAIRALSAMKQSVIATGGGAVLDKDNVEYLARNGLFVLLKADISTMITRIQADETSQQKRPDLVNGGLYQETQTMITERMPTYEKVADMAIDTTGLTIDEVVDKIIQNARIRAELKT
jgi:shikimate kinase